MDLFVKEIYSYSDGCNHEAIKDLEQHLLFRNYGHV